jgi:hypothetical protein
MKLVEELKSKSSRRIKTLDPNYANFYRQDGYGIFSVNPTDIERVITYIQGQEEHHKKQNFQNELLAFLNKYKMEYDEKYLWD